MNVNTPEVRERRDKILNVILPKVHEYFAELIQEISDLADHETQYVSATLLTVATTIAKASIFTATNLHPDLPKAVVIQQLTRMLSE